MDINLEHSKRLIPYIVKTVTSSKFGSLEDMYSIMTLLGDLLSRFPGNPSSSSTITKKFRKNVAYD